MLNLDDLRSAANHIKPYIHRTPVQTCAAIDEMTDGRKFYFKCENFQKTGSFKVRGALNAALRIKANDPKSPGVVTESTGNHGLGLAYAAKKAGMPCSVIVSNDTAASKCDAIRGYGADLYLSRPTAVARNKMREDIRAQYGQQYVSSYNHLDVLAGQATVGLELHEQVDDLDAVFVSVCGGGLAAGVAMATHYLRPRCKVFVVEPHGKELSSRMESGVCEWPGPPAYLDTICDGLRGREVGKVSWSFFKHIENQVFTVKDAEVVEAMKLLWSRMKLVVEPSAAIVVAALLSPQIEKLDPSIKKIGVVLCGGNVDLEKLPWA